MGQSEIQPPAAGIPSTETLSLEHPKLRLASLDGWRALCICMVLCSHADLPPTVKWPSYVAPLFDGNLGVRFFFVISGFLITYLLLREQEARGRISLRHFYIRRALRILPVYFAYLCVIAALQWLGKAHQAPITWAGDATFTVNFLPRGLVSGHLWSLAVEEQFYLLWPGILVLLLARPWNLRWVLAMPFVVALLCRFVSYKNAAPWIIHPLFHYQSSLVNFDSLAAGCVAAFVLAKNQAWVESFLDKKNRRLLVIVAGCALVLAPESSALLPESIKFIAGNLFQAVGFAMLLLASVLYPIWFPVLNWRFVAEAGVLSYSMYIWQQLFTAGHDIFGVSGHWYFTFPWYFGSVLLAAVISYYGFEKPLLRVRQRFREYRGYGGN